MNVGFINIYPYRPHAHHAKFLELQAKALGWKTFALNCDASASSCYIREYKGTGRSECLKCMAGGLRSFSFDHTDSSRKYWSAETAADQESFVLSSAYTLTRIESFEQRQSKPVRDVIEKLAPEAGKFFVAVQRWIKDRALDALIVFNGRMDLNRAAIEACASVGVPYITHERPLFGHGLILNANANCSSLQGIHRINRLFRDRPLSEDQANVASKLAAQRLVGGNPLEWKRYNTSAVSASTWPLVSSGPKVLVCPSSKNELLGHPDWETAWADNTDALDLAVERGWFGYGDMLVRFHPSWAVSFGRVSAERCERHYRDWCTSRGVVFIESASKINTQDLIRHCDVVILNGSNTLFEAGALGKPVICLGSAPYTHSGVSEDVTTLQGFDDLDFEAVLERDPRELIRKTLRYYYSKAAREPLYTDYIRSESVTHCRFFEGANPELLQMLIGGAEIICDDDSFGDSTSFEDSHIEIIKRGHINDLVRLAEFDWRSRKSAELEVSRRHLFRVVDGLRNLTPKGV